MAEYFRSVLDFRQARRRASLEQIMARLGGRSVDLLSYEDVRRKLRAKSGRQAGLRDIPLDAIVGSVGRYSDFTRSFLPRQDSDQERWARVQMAVTDLGGLPPIDVYQVGDVYFVLDGNHRVSVARQLGATQIQAYVTEVQTRVPLLADVQPDDLILKAEYAAFLEQTHLDEIRPQVDLSTTVPGRYPELLEHIEVHRHFMGVEQEREIPYEEAVGHWYDQVYLPVVGVIRQRGILRDFPGRTEADLYLWILGHRAELQDSLNWEVETDTAATDLATRFSAKPRRVIARVSEKLLDAVTPDELEAGPSPGYWREQRVMPRDGDRLFADIMVSLSGEDLAWAALDQALEIARREEARLHGLHVVPSRQDLQLESTLDIQAEFNRRCEEAGVSGRLAFEVGRVARRICERARWTDLTVLHLAHPPAPDPMARLGSGIRTLVRRCPSPVVAVPGQPSQMNRALLAYDGGRKAQEALFVASYLGGCWGSELVVVIVLENGAVGSEALDHALAYLASQGVTAAPVQVHGPAPEAILQTAEEHETDLILMGGYGHSPVVEAVLGSTVDQVLRVSRWPVLVCR